MRNKKDNYRSSSLQKNLFRKYTISFVVFQIIYIIIMSFCMKFLSNKSANFVFMADDVYNSINDNGLKKYLSNSFIQGKSYIEILDLDYRVKLSIKSPHKVGYMYSKDRMLSIANNRIKNLHQYFLAKRQQILLVYEDDDVNPYTTIYALAIIAFLSLMILAYIIFFKVMAALVSKTIGKPLSLLLEGVNAFKNKNYSHRINFNSNNELNELKKAFNSMAAELGTEISERIKAQNINKQMILDITHDLKTPLTNIEGYSELLRENHLLEESVKEKYLDIIISNSKRTNNLIKDLFDYTYFDNKYIVKEKVDFCEMLRRLLVEYIPIIEDNKKQYEFNIPEQSIKVFMNRKMMERAICNIINNFIKYSGDSTKIQFDLSYDETSMELVVSDNGAGISKEKLQDIFLPFVRGDDSRNPKTGGTGLGLAITKKVIEDHGGSIRIEQRQEDGCRFVINLPVSK
ncbi:sensor histidine kinase [Clostridium oryzae]|uniref:histidine kinase n=1 Tax=Clostridium oryzae TaxID=1450648 RepID=A0A1V4I423_9CLOT|nr:HAMP domain-containing sensor histidine kinase [Clostridium oryzae]OPJ54624.1 sensor protein CpxA [Clostridium oryzae]